MSVALPELGGGLTPLQWLRSVAREDRKVRANARAREAEAIADWLEALLAALGRCGACGGSGRYTKRWIAREPLTAADRERGFVKGRPIADNPAREETVVCAKCGGFGVAPAVREALGGRIKEPADGL